MVALLEVVVLRLDPNRGLLTFSASTSSSDPSSSVDPLEKYSTSLPTFRLVPGTLKDFFELLESDSESMKIPPDMLVLFESLKGIKTTYLQSMYETILEWFAAKFELEPLPASADEVSWSGCPYGSNVLDIYKCFGGDTEDLFVKCLVHAGNCKNSKSKKKVPFPPKPTTVSLVNPVKQLYLSEKATVEALPTSSYSTTTKSDPGRLPDSSGFGGASKSNLDGFSGPDSTGGSAEVAADDESLNWFKILSFAEGEQYHRVLNYLDSYYQIPTSITIHRVDSSEFNKLNDLVLKFMKTSTTETVNLILLKAKSLNTQGANPILLFDNLLATITGGNLKRSNALVEKFQSRVNNKWKGNGYVLLAYWLCIDYPLLFGEYDYDTPDEIQLDGQETILAFWNRVVRQSHLFGNTQDDESSYADCYKTFIDGLPEFIRLFVRTELERIYTFDSLKMRSALPKTRGMVHLTMWTSGVSGSIPIDDSIGWLNLNKPRFQKWLNESKKGETASSSNRKNQSFSSPSGNAKSGLFSHKPSPKDKGGFLHSTAKATSSASGTSASDPSSTPTPSSSSSSSFATEPKNSTHRDQNRGKNKKK